MIRKVKQLLEGNSENHLMPFFWQHGEDEETLREYMKVIDECGCKAVCVESRPHPDFCGEKWWTDMDIILDEARKRGMKVWILDDSHFPTGYANGAVKDAPLEQHRQSICAGRLDFAGDAEEEKTVEIDVHGNFPPAFHPNMIESYILPHQLKDAPHFEDDRILSVVAVNHRTGEEVVLDIPAQGEKLSWRKPAGEWAVWITGLSRNFGPHREYINMMDPASCRLLIDAVYEPHWAHYQEDFGKTILCEAQIGFDCIPADVFAEPEHYGTVIGSTLRVNTQEYQALVIPYAEYVTKALAEAAARLRKKGCPVIFVDGLPKGICDLDVEEECQGGIHDMDAGEKHLGGISEFAVGGNCSEEICGCNRGQEQLALTELLAECQVVSLEELVSVLGGLGLPEIRFEPGNTYLRALHYQEECGLYYFVNEGAQIYRGTVTVPDRGCCYVYDAWENACRTIEAKECPEGTRLSVALEPRKSLIVLFDEAEDTVLRKAMTCEGEGVELTHWKRSLCEAVEYPSFREEKEVTLPDRLAQEKPDFSGFVRYESRFTVKCTEAALNQPGQEGLCAERLDTECPVVELSSAGRLLLELTDAYEGVELFVNGRSAGIQIVAPYLYDLTEYIQEGENSLSIEVATTLERKCYDMTKDDPRMKMRRLAEPACGSGITGRVVLHV